MPKVLSLDEATNIIGQINTLDAKLISLIEMHSKTGEKIKNNLKEIERRKSLEHDNETMENNLAQLTKEIGTIKEDIQTYSKKVTDSGWVVPLPKREIPNASSVRM